MIGEWQVPDFVHLVVTDTAVYLVATWPGRTARYEMGKR